MNNRYLTEAGALTIASVCLYSTGHWIGGSILLIFCLFEVAAS